MRLVDQLEATGIRNRQLLDILCNTPRHLFVDEALAHRAYEDMSLPIGHNQTLSRAYTVARMTEMLLASCPARRVLEIGTGSGYQACILAQLATRVYSLERIRSLQEQAARRLQQLDIHNVMLRHGDGYQGWSERSPFDGILVTAAPPEVPQKLLEQLADGGCMVTPVGDVEQYLLKITRHGNQFKQQRIETARFVPLVSGLA
jgi:protein-L-isoaspartate(D-aspartate) O-methyltransferase